MSMRLIDTSAWVEFLRRKGNSSTKLRVAKLLEAGETAYTCPVRFELLSGVKTEEEADLSEALRLSVHVPFEVDDWKAAALLERQLREKGVTVPRNDLFVATVGIRGDFIITCRDSHFDAMRAALGVRLRVEQV
jgi:predicted nucleic acid-binding protein